MNKLNKIFEQNLILTAAELNAITSKVDEIVELISSAGSGSSTITDAQVQEKIDAAKKELNALLDEAVANLLKNVEDLKNAPEGDSQVITAEEWAQYRKKTDGLETDVAAIKLTYDGIDLTALKLKIDDINTWAGQITVDPGKIEILAALLDENNELILNPAAIIAAIVDKDGVLTSEIAISADQVIIGGEVILTNSLTTLRGEISNLTSSNATIRGELDAAKAEIGKKTNNDDFETLKSNLGDLSLVVEGKAAIEDLTALEVTVGALSGNTDFEDLKNDLEDLKLVVNGKAAIEDLNALTVTIGKKASNEDFEKLTKDLSDLSLVVNGKATIADLTALTARVGVLEASKIDADEIKTDILEALDMTIGDGSLTIGSKNGRGEIYFFESGESTTNNVNVSITNDQGITVQSSENTSGETGFIRIGNTNGKFTIYTYHDAPSGSDTYASGSGYGYTGLIGGARFVNGICIGPNIVG